MSYLPSLFVTYLQLCSESKHQEGMSHVRNTKARNGVFLFCCTGVLYWEWFWLFFRYYCNILVWLWVHFVSGNFSVLPVYHKYSVNHSSTLSKPAALDDFLNHCYRLKVCKPRCRLRCCTALLWLLATVANINWASYRHLNFDTDTKQISFQYFTVFFLWKKDT